MPYTYLPRCYLQLNGGRIEQILDGEVVTSITPAEARSNAADLIDAARQAEGGTGDIEELTRSLREQIRHTGNTDELFLVYQALLVLLER